MLWTDNPSEAKLFSVYCSLSAERHIAVELGQAAIINIDMADYLDQKSMYRRFNDIIKEFFSEDDGEGEAFPEYSTEQFFADLDESNKSRRETVVFSDESTVDDTVDIPF